MGGGDGTDLEAEADEDDDEEARDRHHLPISKRGVIKGQLGGQTRVREAELWEG